MPYVQDGDVSIDKNIGLKENVSLEIKKMPIQISEFCKIPLQRVFIM